ncbi:hypothetical protein HDU96_008263 [Phlyctochytrium bullatum]|nr:hypothetical protein HDU96_008263 [Phlyctochytrium bullatum]
MDPAQATDSVGGATLQLEDTGILCAPPSRRSMSAAKPPTAATLRHRRSSASLSDSASSATTIADLVSDRLMVAISSGNSNGSRSRAKELSPMFPASPNSPLYCTSPPESLQLSSPPSLPFSHLNSHANLFRSRSPSPINLKNLDLDMDSVREQMEFLTVSRVDEGTFLDGETPPDDIDMSFSGGPNGADSMEDDTTTDVSTAVAEVLSPKEMLMMDMDRSDSKMHLLSSRTSLQASHDIDTASSASESPDPTRPPSSSSSSSVIITSAAAHASRLRPKRTSVVAPTAPGPFRKMPSAVAMGVVAHLMATADTPDAAAAKALPCLFVNRSWSRGAARALYRTPHLPTLDRFQSLVATALEPSPTHPYAAFVENLHLPPALAETLFLGDLDIAFQLFPNLASLRLHSSPSTSNVLLQSLADHCGSLRALSLRGCPITDALVPHLAAGCPRLELLDLSHTRVTIATLLTCVDLCPHLLTLSLEAAFPSPRPVTWDPQHLFMRPLRHLHLRNSGITDPHLRHAALHCPDLERVVVEGSAAITDDALVKLAQSCGPSLRTLDASFCPHVTDLTLRALAMFAGQNLEAVAFSGCDRVTEDGVVALAEGCVGAGGPLTEIVLHGCVRVLGSSVKEFATRRYELDCAVRGDAVRLLAASRVGRRVAGPLAAAAKVASEPASPVPSAVAKLAKPVLERRESSTQTLAEDFPVSSESTPRGTLTRQPSDDNVAAEKAGGGPGSRLSMPAEELLLKFAEAVATGAWFPRPGDTATAAPPAPFWNPAWGYPPNFPGVQSSDPTPPPQPTAATGLPRPTPRIPRRISASSTGSTASTTSLPVPRSNRSSVGDTPGGSALPTPTHSRTASRKSLGVVPEKPAPQRSGLPAPSGSRLPTTPGMSRIPSIGGGSTSSRLPSAPGIPTPASKAAKEFSMAMLKGAKPVVGTAPAPAAPRIPSASELLDDAPGYKPRQFRKINNDIGVADTAPAMSRSASARRPAASTVSTSSSVTAYTATSTPSRLPGASGLPKPPGMSRTSSVDPAALAAFKEGLPAGVASSLAGAAAGKRGSAVAAGSRTSVQHPLAPSGVATGWISGGGEGGSGGDRRSTGSSGSSGSSGSVGSRGSGKGVGAKVKTRR